MPLVVVLRSGARLFDFRTRQPLPVTKLKRSPEPSPSKSPLAQCELPAPVQAYLRSLKELPVESLTLQPGPLLGQAAMPGTKCATSVRPSPLTSSAASCPSPGPELDQTLMLKLEPVERETRHSSVLPLSQ